MKDEMPDVLGIQGYIDEEGAFNFECCVENPVDMTKYYHESEVKRLRDALEFSRQFIDVIKPLCPVSGQEALTAIDSVLKEE